MNHQENLNRMWAGFAEVDWTPEPGYRLMGQMHERIATHARDALCACAAAFRLEEKTVVLVAVDVCWFSTATAQAITRQWREMHPGQDTHLILHATHTHVAPPSEHCMLAEGYPEITTRIRHAVMDAAQAAVAALVPAEIFAGAGALEMMGWNRRAMMEDGSSRMYGHSQLPGFVGMEGPRDPYLPLIWAQNTGGQVLGVITGFATHPNSVEGECYYCADIPGAVRRHLRAALGTNAGTNVGTNVGVVYLTQSAGNTAPSILDPYDGTQPWRGEEGLERSGRYLAGELLKVMAVPRPPMLAALGLAQTTLHLGLRDFPAAGAFDDPNPWAEAAKEYYRKARAAWPEYKAAHEPCPVPVSAMRLGEALLCFNPAELFVEFGLELRRQSPGVVTLVTELTDGCCGYVPTRLAFSRSGYETWCAPSSMLVPEAGEEIVAASLELARELFPAAGQ